MKKKIILFLLAICCIAIVPAIVSKSEVKADSYDLWIGNTHVTSEKLSGDGWKFDPNTNTLTLNGFAIGSNGQYLKKIYDGSTWAYAIIYSEKGMNLTIHTEGKASCIGDDSLPGLQAEKLSDGTYRVFTGIHNPGGSVTFTGSAALNISVNYFGIYAGTNGQITFDNSGSGATITVYGGGAMVAKNINFKGNSVVRAWCGHGGVISTNNVFATNNINISDNAELYSNIESARDVGVFSVGCNGTLNALGGKLTAITYTGTEDDENPTFRCFGIKTKRLVIGGGAIVDSSVANSALKNYRPSTAVGIDIIDEASVHFNGAGTLRTAIQFKNPNGNNTDRLYPSNVTYADHVLHESSTGRYGYDLSEEIKVYSRDGIYLWVVNNNVTWWAYDENKSYKQSYSRTLELKDKIMKGREMPLVAENGTHPVDPAVNTDCEIPEMTVKSGATLTLKFNEDNDYIFTKPIHLENGILEIEGGDGPGIIKGLDIRGIGTVKFLSGTVSGNVEKTVKAVMFGPYEGCGNIDIPDYGNAVDEKGNTVHKFAYKAETEYDYFYRACLIYELEERDFYRLWGVFHKKENGDKMLYIWTDRADRPHRIDAYPSPGNSKNSQPLSLKYGTNTFAPGTPFTMKDNGFFTAKAGDNVVLSPLAGGNPTDLQKSFISWVKWYVSKDGGENFELVQRTQGPTFDNTDGPYASKTIRFEYVLPEITEAQNGYIYRCEVCYYDVIEYERNYYYYDAALYVDTVQLTEPERYIENQPARLGITSITPPDGVGMKYTWQISKDGGNNWETVQNGDYSAYETAAVTEEMEGWQVRVVYSIYEGDKKLSGGITDPVTIDTIGKLPVIITQPKSAVLRQHEVYPDQFPPDPDKIPIIFGGPYYSFSIEAEGENLRYRWQRSKDNGRTFEDLLDETEARTAFFSVEAGAIWQFRCIVYNDFGSTISDVATLRMLYAPTVGNPQDLTVLEHNEAVFRVSFSQGLPYGTDVVWQVSKDGQTMVDVTAEDGTVNVYSEAVNGAIHWYTTLTIGNVSQDMSGYMYRCIVKNQPNDEDYNGLRRSEHATLTVKYNCNVDGHIFDEGTVTKEPTCTASGSAVFTCSACDLIDTRYIEPLGHDWKPATCRSVKTCLREDCGISEGNFDYTNHIGEPVWNTEDWNDADGHMSRWSCCGIIEYPYERHTFENGKCPTCGCICSHPLKFAANCHEEGKCEICGLKTEDVNPNNHDTSLGTYLSDQKDATCTEEGFTGNIKCWECRGTITPGKTIEKTAHTGGTATCFEQAICKNCDTPYGDLDPKNHGGYTEFIGMIFETCTEEGYSGDLWCTKCNTLVEKGFAIPAEHKWYEDEWVIKDAPAFGKTGRRYHECIKCGEEIESEVMDEITFETVNLRHNCSFGNDLSMLYAILKTDLAGCTDIRLIVEKETFSGNAPSGSVTKTLFPKEYSINGVAYYRFDYSEVKAKELGDTLTAKLLFVRDGTEYSGTIDEYSIKQYALERMEYSEDGDYRTLMVELLNYGSAAQTYFGYRTDALVYDDVDEYYKKYFFRYTYDELNAIEETYDDGIAYPASITQKNISFDNRIELLVATSLDKDNDLDGISLKIKYTDRNGKEVERSINGSDFVYRDDVKGYTAYFDGFKATELRTVMELTLLKNGEAISATVKYNFDAYAENRFKNSSDDNFKALLERTLIYSDCAKDYFTKTSD